MAKKTTLYKPLYSPMPGDTLVAAKNPFYPETYQPTVGTIDVEKAKKDIGTPITPAITSKKPEPIKDVFAVEPWRDKTLNTTGAIKVANWINAANAVAGIGLGIYGLNQVDNMKAPDMVSAPTIEAKQIRDSGSQQMAARKSAIVTSANTTRESLRRSGRTDLLAAVNAKEMAANNEAAAAIEGLRTNIEAQNVAAENRVREINASNKVNSQQFNAQLQNSFRQFQSQMKNSILNTSLSNVSNNIAGIGQNLYTNAAQKKQDDYNERALRYSAIGK